MVTPSWNLNGCRPIFAAPFAGNHCEDLLYSAFEWHADAGRLVPAPASTCILKV